MAMVGVWPNSFHYARPFSLHKVTHSVQRSSLPAFFYGKCKDRAPVCAQLVSFKARRKVDVSFQSGALPPELYVKEVERIVKITFPDSARIRFLGDSTWRATLKPVHFFHLSATPACDIRVFHEDTSLKISSNKLVLDFKGIPVQFKHLDFDFLLSGQLYVDGSEFAAVRREESRRFQGWVDLGLKVDLPLPFSMMPEAILIAVGDAILDRILSAMESALVGGLVRDYKQWCRTQNKSVLPLPTEVTTYIS